jgi:hypothetical protein
VVVVAVGMSDLCGGRPLLLLPSFVATIWKEGKRMQRCQTPG